MIQYLVLDIVETTWAKWINGIPGYHSHVIGSKSQKLWKSMWLACNNQLFSLMTMYEVSSQTELVN